jgi:hypothetical protein
MASTYGIKVYQYNTDGSFISEFKSISEAQDLNGINNISLSLHNKRNCCSSGGYIWTFIYYMKLPQSIIDNYDDRLYEKFNVPIYKYDIEGNFIEEYSSLSKITKIKGERNGIRSVLKGETKTNKNYIYLFKKYKKLPKSILNKHINKWGGFIIQYDLNRKKIKEWSSAYQASITLKIPRTNINRCLKGKSKQANGFIWKYKDN